LTPTEYHGLVVKQSCCVFRKF